MAWLLVVTAAILSAIGAAVWCGRALAQTIYGHRVGRGAKGRRQERDFLPSDVAELDEAFRRVVRSL